MDSPPLSIAEVRQLRDEHYNATLIDVQEIHDDLRILRVQPDGGMPALKAGQYTALGLGFWEPRVDGTETEQVDDSHLRRLCKRAYSFSCSLLDEQDRLLRLSDCPYFEFYVALIRQAEKRTPSLTPRLFGLNRGDRLFVEHHAAGHYTLATVQPTDDVLLLSTGTGEAPHNAMVAELLGGGHAGRIAAVCCTRFHHDLAYAEKHRRLERRFGNYRYIALTTREPQNTDPSRPDFVGKQYLQEFVASDRLEQTCGPTLDPARMHVFLCGNPAMIGAPGRPGSESAGPRPGGMVEVLTRRGFHLNEPRQPGNVHFEKYW